MNGQQQHELAQILVAAFPRQANVTRMVRYGLNENLWRISNSPSLDDVVFELVEWALRHNRMRDLLVAALEDNPDHTALRAFAAEFGIQPPPASPLIA